jgi:hypothetical protein
VPSGGGTFDASFATPATSRADRLGVVAIVRERSSHRVLGAGSLDP